MALGKILSPVATGNILHTSKSNIQMSFQLLDSGNVASTVDILKLHLNSDLVNKL